MHVPSEIWCVAVAAAARSTGAERKNRSWDTHSWSKPSASASRARVTNSSTGTSLFSRRLKRRAPRSGTIGRRDDDGIQLDLDEEVAVIANLRVVERVDERVDVQHRVGRADRAEHVGVCLRGGAPVGARSEEDPRAHDVV